MSEKNRIGKKVKLIRESRKLSIEDVSERTNLSAEGIASIEKGELIPGLTPLIKIARVLGVRLGTFMDDQENETDKEHATRWIAREEDEEGNLIQETFGYIEREGEESAQEGVNKKKRR